MPNMTYSPDSDRSEIFRKSGADILLRLGQLVEQMCEARHTFLRDPQPDQTAEVVSQVSVYQEEVRDFFAKHRTAAMRKHVLQKTLKSVDVRTCRILGYLAYCAVCDRTSVYIMHLARAVSMSDEPAEVLENRRVIAALGTHGLVQSEYVKSRWDPAVRLSDSVMYDLLGRAPCIADAQPHVLQEIGTNRRGRLNIKGRSKPPKRLANPRKQFSTVADFVNHLGLPSPRELVAAVKELGYIGQERACKSVALAAYRHISRLRQIHLEGVSRSQLPPVENVLCLGPTGCGKTYLAKLLFQEVLQLPTVILDSTVYSETGYVGGDITSIPTHLLQAADGNLDVAQASVCVLDEFDKLAETGSGGQSHVSRHGVQRGLLKLLEPGMVDCPIDLNGFPWRARRTQFRTDDVLWIACGAFSGLDYRCVRQSAGIGFSSVADSPATPDLSVRTFESYGVLPELMGRFPSWVRLDKLGRDSLEQILRGSTVDQYAREFDAQGIRLIVEDTAIDLVVTKASDRDTGARGLQAELVVALEDAAFAAYSAIPKPEVARISATAGRIEWNLERTGHSKRRRTSAVNDAYEQEVSHAVV